MKKKKFVVSQEAKEILRAAIDRFIEEKKLQSPDNPSYEKKVS